MVFIRVVFIVMITVTIQNPDKLLLLLNVCVDIDEHFIVHTLRNIIVCQLSATQMLWLFAQGSIYCLKLPIIGGHYLRGW